MPAGWYENDDTGFHNYLKVNKGKRKGFKTSREIKLTINI